jgi:hypothetical protein
MADSFTIANFRHAADGLQEGQFAIGEKTRATSLLFGTKVLPSMREL